MFSYLVFCVVLLASGNYGSFDSQLDGNQDRVKRVGPAHLGTQAWTKLITGSTRMWSKTPFIREHKKIGDYATAVDEFLSLRPENVREFQSQGGVSGLMGQVGDRTVTLKDKGDSFPSFPTIEIHKTGDTGAKRIVDKIRYIDGKSFENPNFH